MSPSSGGYAGRSPEGIGPGTVHDSGPLRGPGRPGARARVSTDDIAHAAAEAAARRSYGKLVAFVCARTRDVAAAEDALSAAFESALRDWPAHGVPANPEAWLLTAARRQAIDAARRRRTQDEIGRASCRERV